MSIVSNVYIPTDCLRSIFSGSDSQELNRLSLVSKAWYKACCSMGVEVNKKFIASKIALFLKEVKLSEDVLTTLNVKTKNEHEFVDKVTFHLIPRIFPKRDPYGAMPKPEEIIDLIFKEVKTTDFSKNCRNILDRCIYFVKVGRTPDKDDIFPKAVRELLKNGYFEIASHIVTLKMFMGKNEEAVREVFKHLASTKQPEKALPLIKALILTGYTTFDNKKEIAKLIDLLIV